ncbi:MAG: hypothetical protein JST00_09500 [Deltaproteobacteria bacterium]|nr:hypothetical protein [Deltaproteobacteria bacterium]
MTVVARIEPSLGARVVARAPLLYVEGPSAALDRPAHVRAGSALAHLGGRTFAVIQDDASFVALVDIATRRATSIALPSDDGVRQFDDARGNKKKKLDLEASIALDGGALLVAFGSGSSPLRERVVLVDGAASDAPRVTLVEARGLYEAMRAATEFSGCELNVEGAAVSGDDVVFFQRGNGAATAERPAVDATARVDRAALLAYLRDPSRPAPQLRAVTVYDLGRAGTTRLTFTDGASRPGPLTAFLACAEDCPDATRDGPVTGVSIGRLDDRAGICEHAPILDESGAPLLDKAEGLAFDAGDATRAFVVVDKDDARIPSELLELRLGEGWRT